MADTIVATYGGSGGTTTSFHYCGSRAASGPGFFGEPTDSDVIRVWLNQYWPDPSDYAHVVVTAHSDAGSSTDEYVWVATPGGTHITHFGDEDGGEGDLTIPNEFYDSGYFEIRIGSRADLLYCFDVYVNGEPIPPTVTHLVVDAPPTADLSTPFDFTVTAEDDTDITVTDYAGTVHFTATDGDAEIPIDDVLTSGTGTFSATLNTPGNWTITATDTVDGTITGTSDPIAVLGPDGTYDGWWGLAHSGRDTFWAARTDLSSLADEYTFEGDLVQTVQLAYPARHAWLGPDA